jgi:serine/threonine-protein phosphatase 2A regulatory subunit B'
LSEYTILGLIEICANVSNKSERQHAVDRYEQWLKLREKAIQNAGGKLPEGFMDEEPAPPPPPVDENDILDLSMDLNAIALDAEVPLGELDESGIERVPMADPGMDVCISSVLSMECDPHNALAALPRGWRFGTFPRWH